MIPTVEKTDEAISELGTTSIDFRDSLTSLVTQVSIAGVALSSFGVSVKGLPSLIRKQFSGGGIRGVAARKRLFDRNFELGEQSPNFRRDKNRFFRFSNRKAASGIGGRLGEIAGRGGRLGGAARFAAGGLSKSLGLISRFAGPIGIASGALFGLNKVIGAGLGLQEKYNNATKLGNVERAKELAVLKQAPAAVALFGEGIS